MPKIMPKISASRRMLPLSSPTRNAHLTRLDGAAWFGIEYADEIAGQGQDRARGNPHFDPRRADPARLWFSRGVHRKVRRIAGLRPLRQRGRAGAPRWRPGVADRARPLSSV